MRFTLIITVLVIVATSSFARTCFQFRDYNLPPDFDGNLYSVACDIDLDGDDDIITSAIYDVIKFYVNTGLDENDDSYPEFHFENWRCDYNTYDPDSLGEGIGILNANDDDFPDIFLGTCRNWGHGGLQNVLLINDGTGNFYKYTSSIPLRNDRTHPIAIADLNNDGLDDIIVGNGTVYNDSAIIDRSYILMNSGILNADGIYMFFDPHDSSLYEDSVWSDSFCARDIATADFDGNGYKDIFFANGLGSCKLFYNHCSSPGAIPRFVNVSDSLPDTLKMALNYSSIAAADFDNDGDIDIVVSIYGGPCMMFLRETSGFVQDEFPSGVFGYRRKIKVVDVNNDGYLDLVTADQILGLYLNDPTSPGHFVCTSTTMVEENHIKEMFTVRDVAIGDFNNDGNPDLFSADYFEQNRLYINEDGYFRFATFSNYPADGSDDYALSSCDIDEDGDLDLFFGGRSDSLHFYENIGGIFIKQNSYINNQDWTDGNSNRVRDFTFGDFNHDGLIDFIAGGTNASNPVINNHIYINIGENHFDDSTRFNIPWFHDSPAQNVFLINSDGDSLPDLFVASVNPGSDEIYQNHGDTDGDGVDNFIYRNNAIPNVPGISTLCDCADINGDGIDDILLAKSNVFGAQNAILIGNGDGTYADSTNLLLPPSGLTTDTTNAARFGDVNGDGYEDILIINFCEQNRLYIFDHSAGIFIDATDSLPDDSECPDKDARFIDIDNDGDLDIAIIIRTTGTSYDRHSTHPRIYINDGSGRFLDSTENYIPDIGLLCEHHERLEVGDFDNDGFCDLATQADGQSRIWWNEYSLYMGINSENVRGPKKISITAYPNPFNSSCKIIAPVETENLEIYDLRGNVIMPSPSVYVPKRKGKEIPSHSGLRCPTRTERMRNFVWCPFPTIPSGIYLLRAKMDDGQTITKKIIYMK